MKKKNKNLTIQFSLLVEKAVNNENINEQDENDAKSIFKKLRTNINFALNENEIIYHIDDDSRRSCISIFVKREIFRLVHDENHHFEIHRSYNRISSILYISRLFKKIRKYIEHCSICQLAQTKRHRLYDELMSIISTSRFFHIIAIDFIFVLFDELNIIMFVTCKHFRKTSLILDKKTYETKKWINALLNRLLITDWDISKAIIFDRDSKFMSNLWQVFFIRLSTRLLVATAYHSQIDEIFERTNQTVKIAIRYFIIEHSDIDYVLTLSSIQAQLNNSLNTATNLVSNEMIYDFKIRDALFNITKVNIVNAQDLSIQRLKYQRETIDVTVFATTKVKIYYDVRHTSILLKKDEYVYLRLNKEYKLSKRFNSKLSQQRCEFFKILQRVERLTYKLNLSSTWRVHSVIFIAQLKSVFVDFDFYQRLRLHHSNSVEMKKDTNEYRFYEIDKLVNKRTRKYNKTLIIQYLVRWIDYEFEFDEWQSVFDFQNSLNLIQNYELNHSKKFNDKNDKRRTRRWWWSNDETKMKWRREFDESVEFLFFY